MPLCPWIAAQISTRTGMMHPISLLDQPRVANDLLDGAFIVECLDKPGLTKAREIVERYRDLGIGLADASLVVVADGLGTHRILTLDERHFRVIQPLDGGSFTVLPADG